MENTTTTKNGFTMKQNLIGLSVIGIIFLALFFWVLSAPAAAQQTYSPKTPEAEKNYQQLQVAATKALQDYCKDGWKPLAQAKIVDAANGHNPDNVDLNKMNSITNSFDCSSVKAPAGF